MTNSLNKTFVPAGNHGSWWVIVKYAEWWILIPTFWMKNHNKKDLSLRCIQDNHLNLSPWFWHWHCIMWSVKATYFMPFSGQLALFVKVHTYCKWDMGNWWGLHFLPIKQSGKMSSWSLRNFIYACFQVRFVMSHFI